MVERHIESGALRTVLTGWQADPLPLHVVFPPNRHISNKVRVFVDWVAERLALAGLAQRRADGT
jgi:DNA-binding transcriptional LysR family regulator